MAWPQAPQPAPVAASGPALPIGPLVTAAAGVLTFFFSFVRIAKAETFGVEVGWSVWTVDDVPPGLFGVGTYIPVLALVAGGAALAGSFVAGLRQRSLGGFTVLQVQEIAAGGAALLWLGYLIGIVLGDADMGLGLGLLFLGVVGVGAGTVLTAMEAGRAGTTGAPPDGTWAPPAPPGPAAPDSGTWQQPVDPASGQWQQPAASATGSWAPSAPPDPGSWQQPPPPATWEQTAVHGQPAVPGGWPQSDPRPSDPYAPQPGSPGPVPEPGPLDPQPAPPVDPQPEPAPAPGVLTDPGTQVIPGPPPAPPADGGGGTGGPPPPPPTP